MNYIKSAGFYSVFYVILYFGISIGLRFFVTDSDLFTGLFYLILLAATLIYLKVCGDDMKTTLRIRPIHIGSFFLVILLAFTIRPVAGFITLIANLFFKDVTTTTMTEKVMQNLSLSIFTTAFLPGLVEETIFRGVVYSRVRKGKSDQRNFTECFILWNCPYELSTVLLCFFPWNRLWLSDRSYRFHCIFHDCSYGL